MWPQNLDNPTPTVRLRPAGRTALRHHEPEAVLGQLPASSIKVCASYYAWVPTGVPPLPTLSPPGRHRGDERGLDAAAELLRALANPHRLAIVVELGAGPRCVHELVDALGISQPLASQHLRVLKAVHVVRSERRGREIAYSLGDDHVSHIVHDAMVHTGEMVR